MEQDRQVFKKLRYASLLVRRGGTGTLLGQFLSRLYSTSTYVWLAKDLGLAEPPREPVERTLRLASPEDVQGILDGLRHDKGRDVFEILRRVSFYRRGFDACYLAHAASGEACHIGWLLSARHNGLIRSDYPPGTDELQEGEALVENILTFPRHRGRGIMLSVLREMEDLARSQGLRRMIAYVDVNNTPSLKGFERAGYKPFAREKEYRRFFRMKRTGQRGL
jgi:RimJ/RimL family protein N-acetyltransferase